MYSINNYPAETTTFATYAPPAAVTRFPCPWPVQEADEDGIYITGCEAPAATYADGTGWACVNGHHDRDESYLHEDPVDNALARHAELMYHTT